jgi:hypothetical protein
MPKLGNKVLASPDPTPLRWGWRDRLGLFLVAKLTLVAIVPFWTQEKRKPGIETNSLCCRSIGNTCCIKPDEFGAELDMVVSRALKLAQRKTYKTRHSEVSFASISEVQTAGRGRGQARAKRARRVGLTPVASCRIDGGRDGGRLHPMPLCKFPRRGSVQRTVRAL